MAEWICPNCEYIYDEATGDPREGWPAGTPFAEIDADWTCPDCGVREQVDFVPRAEFTHNDQDGDIISMETRSTGTRQHGPRPGAESSQEVQQ